MKTRLHEMRKAYHKAGNNGYSEKPEIGAKTPSEKAGAAEEMTTAFIRFAIGISFLRVRDLPPGQSAVFIPEIIPWGTKCCQWKYTTKERRKPGNFFVRRRRKEKGEGKTLPCMEIAVVSAASRCFWRIEPEGGRSPGGPQAFRRKEGACSDR